MTVHTQRKPQRPSVVVRPLRVRFPTMSYELAILGAGNMAEAIPRGVLARGVFTPQQISAADPMPARRDLCSQQLKIPSVSDTAEAARNAKVLLLSTKPYQMKEAL